MADTNTVLDQKQEEILREDFDKIVKEAKENSKDGKDATEIFSQGIDQKLKKYDLPEVQKGFLKTSLLLYMQGRIDNHLQDTLPEEFFTRLDELLDKGEAKAEDVIGTTIMAYELVMGQSILVYVNLLLDELIPQFVEIIQRNEEEFEKLQALPAEEQEKFMELVRDNKYDEASNLLSQ